MIVCNPENLWSLWISRMNEVEIITEINKVQEKMVSATEEEKVVLQAELDELMSQLQPVEKSRDQQAFLDECAG